MKKGIVVTKVVIAEKTELGRDIARAICGKDVGANTPLPISGNGYTVVAASGHLLNLVSPGDIRADWERGPDFDMELLPIFVPNWQKEVSEGRERKMEQIAKALGSATEVIHAGDPDDEGQLIVDDILEYLGWSGPVKRVFVNDNIDINIQKAFEKLEDNALHVSAGRAAYARQMADYAFGVNESRLASHRLGTGVSIGRVQTPTLGLIVRRDLAIASHEVQHFYKLLANINIKDKGTCEFTFKPSKELLDGEKHIYDRLLLEEVAQALSADEVEIITKVKQEKTHAPMPYNLTILQAEMNAKHGFSSKKTLELTQSLRDNHKAITYNRTDSRHLKDEHYNQAPRVLGQACKNLGVSTEEWELDFSIRSKAFNDEKTTAHHGIIPQLIEFDTSSLSADELIIYEAIVLRYALQFLPPILFDKSTSVFEVSGYTFEYVMKKVTDSGWNRLAKTKSAEKVGEEQLWLESSTYFGTFQGHRIEEGETTPPKHYIEGTLIKDMTSIAKYVKDPTLKEALRRKDEDNPEENGSIGTVATRDEIIDTLEARGFIERKGKKVLSTEKGRRFYDAIPDSIKSADVTAKWWLMQEAIAAGDLDVNAIQEDVVKVFNSHKDTAYIGKSLKVIVGKCPNCSDKLAQGDKAYICASNKYRRTDSGTWSLESGCGFMMFRVVAKKDLPLSAVKALIERGKTDKPVTGLKGKSGKPFSAHLILDSKTGKISLKVTQKKDNKKSPF